MSQRRYVYVIFCDLTFPLSLDVFLFFILWWILQPWKISSSPQSALYGCKQVSIPVSPKSVSQVSSPPLSEGVVSWDLFSEAAEQVARLRVNKAAAACYLPKMTYPPLKPYLVTVPPFNRCQASEFHLNPKTQAQLSYQKMQAIQVRDVFLSVLPTSPFFYFYVRALNFSQPMSSFSS